MLLALLVGCPFEEVPVVRFNDSGFGGTGASFDQPDSTDTDDSGDATDSGDSGADSGGSDLPDWTVLVFVNGDNDLEKWALADVNEMEAVGSTDRVNVVVQLDRSPGIWAGDDDWSGARRYRIEHDEDVRTIASPVLADLGDVDSGDPATVEDFVRWGLENYPAHHTMLVFWDHGDGWSFAPDAPETKGISYDYSTGHNLSVAGGDVTAVVHDAATVLGRPLDAVGFDACTMAQWEVAFSVADDAGILVASEDYEDVAGWPYDTVLADLTTYPQMDAAELGASIALRFHEIPDSTMSVVDLSQLPALTDALDLLSDTLVASGTAGPLFAAAAPISQGYDGPNSRQHDLLDLLDAVATYSPDADVLAATAGAQAAARDTVVVSYYEGEAVKGSSGLTIWSPSDGTLPPIYAAAPWAVASRWDEAIAAAAP